MKFLEEPKLSYVNSVLSGYEVGDRVIHGKIETYSCKKAGLDKKLAKTLDSQYQLEAEILAASDALPMSSSSVKSSSSSGGGGMLSCSPLGSLTSASTRKLLINLITTMNASFPDYDFSSVKPEQFYKEGDFRIVINAINRHLAELLENEKHCAFGEKLWTCIAQSIKPEECEVYSYIPDMDSDPFSDGNLWSFNYFFVNKHMKKILYFTCISTSAAFNDSAEDEMLDDDDQDDPEAMDEDMDDEADYFSTQVDWEDGA